MLSTITLTTSVEVLATLLALAIGGVVEVLRRHRRALAALAAVAATDELTGLANRRAFKQELTDNMARATRGGSALGVAMLDLDHFKAYNDRYGHRAGDVLLARFADGAANRLREVDLIARVGGEEFAVVLPLCDLEEAGMAVDRLRAALPDGQSFSAGVARWDGAESVDAVMDRADQSLYEAKGAGRATTMKAFAATLATELALSPQAPAEARGALGELAEELEPEALESLRLLVSELVASHVRDDVSGSVQLRVWVSPSTVRAGVTGTDARHEKGAPRQETRLVGQSLVNELSDRVGASVPGSPPE